MADPAQSLPEDPPKLGDPPKASVNVLNQTRVVAAADRKVELSDLSPDQREAYAEVLRWFEARAWEKSDRERVFPLAGLAGTGKTLLTSLLIEELLNRGKKLAIVTPTGKASTVIARKLGKLAARCEYVGTLHGFMYLPILNENEELVGWSRRYFEKVGDSYVAKSGKIPKLDLLIADESSMLNRELESDIEAFGLPVLAVGDHGQLSPVHGQSSWMKNPRVRLEKIHRQAEENPILALATYIRETGQIPKGSALLDIGIGYHESLKAASPAMIETFERNGFQDTALICFTNDLRCRLNLGIHQHFLGSKTPTQGTQVICLKNDAGIGLINGMRGRIRDMPVKQGVWTIAEVEFPDENVLYCGPFVSAQFGLSSVIPNVEEASKLLGLRVPTMKKLGAFLDFGYSLTCHKAQGSQFNDVFVVLQQGCTPNDFARWAYTAVTRAAQRLTIVDAWG